MSKSPNQMAKGRELEGRGYWELDDRGQESGARSHESEVRDQRSGVRSQRSEVRSQGSELRGQESEVRNQASDNQEPGFCNLQSQICNPQSLNPEPRTLNPESSALRPPQFWIGTSGYSYREWIGPFYPPGTRPAQMLEFYTEEFPIVELNFTFYSVPTETAFEHMVQRTPDGFQFLVKMHSDITHARELGGIKRFLGALEPLREQGRLAGILCQFPQSFHLTRVAALYLIRLAERLQGYPSFVELRHRSWDTHHLVRDMAALGLGIVSVDVPDIPSLFPRRLVRCGSAIYIRFHSRAAENWYADGKDRYDYLYGWDEMEEWLEEMGEIWAETERVYLLFNNCRKAQAAQNAAQVKRLLEQQYGPDCVKPPSRSRPRQLELACTL